MSKELEFHPLSELGGPLLEGDDFDRFVADIKAHGGRPREGIVLHEGKILDGRNLYRALRALGESPEDIKEIHCLNFKDWHEGSPRAYVISMNVHRRHLTPEERRAALARKIKADPTKSDRAIAKEEGVDHKTVAKARREAESTGEASPVEKRVGADGKARKAKTPRQRKIAQNKARREKHAEWIERRLVFADKVHRWVRSLSAEQAKGLQNLLEEKEFADTFVFRESLREGVEFNLTGVQASCWRIQMTKEGQRRGNVVYFDWENAKQCAALMQEKNPGWSAILVPVLESDGVRSAAVPNALIVDGEPSVVHPCYGDADWVEETEGGHEAYTALKVKRAQEGAACEASADDPEASAEAMKAKMAALDAAAPAA